MCRKSNSGIRSNFNCKWHIGNCIGDKMTDTPDFQGTHLWDRLCWAKENLEPFRTEYCVVWEDQEEPDSPAKDE